jgi:hypothetical protein
VLLGLPPLQQALLAHLPRTLTTLQLAAWTEWQKRGRDYQVVTADGSGGGGGSGGSSDSSSGPPVAITPSFDDWLVCDGDFWVTPVWSVVTPLLAAGDSALTQATMELLAGECSVSTWVTTVACDHGKCLPIHSFTQ